MAQRQRKGLPPKQGGGNTVFYIVLGVIALGGILAIGYAVMGGAGGTAATELVELDIPDARALYDQATPVTLGQADAPVKIIEFADYQCGGCRQFALGTKPRIEQEFITSGQAQFVLYDFPLVSIHRHAFLAARAARCAGEQPLAAGGGADGGAVAAEEPAPGSADPGPAYWAYHDKLFQEQGSWAARSSVTDDFVGYAEEIGLDAGQFERCLRSDRFADVVTANRRLGDQLRIMQTPTILINNRRVEPDAGSIAEAIRAQLGG